MHFWFQGNKLQLHDQIGSYHIKSGDFVVLIPFVKKEATQKEKPNSLFSSPNVACNASTSSFADTTWSNIMEDLSELRETTEEIDVNKQKTVEVEMKRGLGSEKEINLPYHMILNTLDYTSGSAEVFPKVLESVNCLSDLPLGYCKLLKRACLKGNDGGGVTCLCPPWLKMVLKSFAFINIFSAFLHLQSRKVTTSLLGEALDQLAKLGVKLGIHDMKRLSLLCPHVNWLIYLTVSFI